MLKEEPSLPDSVREVVTDPRRREVLAGLGALQAGNDPEFGRLTKLAARMFGLPISAVSLVDGERVCFRSGYGFELSETPIDQAFCAHAISNLDGRAFVVPDASRDQRFAGSALVREHGIRFYAGAPVKVHGQHIGTILVLDRVAHLGVGEDALNTLMDLGATVSALFELKNEARVRAETAAELIKEEWRHALTLEAGKVGSWVWDISTDEVLGNDIFRRMLGFEPMARIRMSQVLDAMHPQDLPAVRAAIAETFAEGVDYASEFRTPSGRWLIARGRVYQRDASGNPLVMMGVNIDISEAREAADQTRLLLRELNHRVKNTLAMIQSLAGQTMRQTPDPRQFLDAFSGRLRTLSEAHALLSDHDWTGIQLRDLIQSQIEPFTLDSPDRVSVSGDDLVLPPDHALGLGLVLHELTSNAAKYGALSAEAGRVEISWTQSRDAEPRLDLVWREVGGPKVDRPRMLGFGGRLIERSLDKVLDSRVSLDFSESGVVARVSLPLSQPAQ